MQLCSVDEISHPVAQVDIVADTGSKNTHSTRRMQEHPEDEDDEDDEDEGEDEEEALLGAALGCAMDTSSPQREEQLRVAAAQCGAQSGSS